MSKPSHNAKLPFPLYYRDQLYESFTDLWSMAKTSTKISQSAARSRLRKRLKTENLSDDLWDECLFLDQESYRSKYGTRKTLIQTEDGIMCAQELFEVLSGSIPYKLFRQRLRSIEDRNDFVTRDHMIQAKNLSKSDWMTAHGGGRRKKFVYDGNAYPDAHGKYPSFAAFLKEVRRYEDRHTLARRLRAKWIIDDLLREPIVAEGKPGFIYSITELSSGKSYIGLSVNKPKVRFGQHIQSAKNGSGTPLHIALNKFGIESFKLKTIETVDGDETTLKEREKYWIKKLDTLQPNGFNVTEGGEIGRYDGLPVEFEGRSFPSVAEMRRTLSEETGIAEHVIENRWRQNRPFTDKVRVHSKHPEAGSPLFRQWLGMHKRAKEHGAEVDSAWEDFDTWKSDVSKIPKNGERLTRLDQSRPWGPDNITWMDHADIVRRSHGQTFSAFGKTWETKQDALDEYKISRNTFDLRIASGVTVEDALTTPLGPTSRNPFEFENESFASRNEACNILADRYEMTAHQVKDYLSRNVPSHEWPKFGIHVRSGPGVKVRFKVDGIEYSSQAELCREYSISQGTFQKRRRNGMSVSEALKAPIKDTSTIIFGHEWSSAKSACKAFGLAPNTFKARITKKGMSPEEALMNATTRGYAGVSIEQIPVICKTYAIRKVTEWDPPLSTK